MTTREQTNNRENMTPNEKRSDTAQQKRVAEQERRRDRAQAIAICRKIRDDENATDHDRLTAIQILNAMSA